MECAKTIKTSNLHPSWKGREIGLKGTQGNLLVAWRHGQKVPTMPLVWIIPWHVKRAPTIKTRDITLGKSFIPIFDMQSRIHYMHLASHNQMGWRKGAKKWILDYRRERRGYRKMKWQTWEGGCHMKGKEGDGERRGRERVSTSAKVSIRPYIKTHSLITNKRKKNLNVYRKVEDNKLKNIFTHPKHF